jgi:hypothetical protein
MKSFSRRGVAVITLWIAAVGIGGCSNQPAHMQDLKDRVLQSYTTSNPDRLYYIGSDDTFDYFYLQNESQRYKVPKSESTQIAKMTRTDDRALWQVVSPASALDGAVLETK